MKSPVFKYLFNKVTGLLKGHKYPNKPAAFSCFENYLRTFASEPSITEYSSLLS